jgi:hypothetical protein
VAVVVEPGVLLAEPLGQAVVVLEVLQVPLVLVL